MAGAISPPTRFLEFRKNHTKDDEKLSKLTNLLEQRNAQVLNLDAASHTQENETKKKKSGSNKKEGEDLDFPIASHDRDSGVSYAGAILKIFNEKA